MIAVFSDAIINGINTMYMGINDEETKSAK